MSTFVFFHVGPDLTMPTAMVASIRHHNPGAEIIQVTDNVTPTVSGVTWAHPTSGDPEFLMLWRTQAFAALQLAQPALYMDTDMLVRRPVHPEMLLGDAVIAVTRRTFMREAIFNVHQRGQDYSEHANKTLDQVYPYIGCGTITPTGRRGPSSRKCTRRSRPNIKRGTAIKKCCAITSIPCRPLWCSICQNINTPVCQSILVRSRQLLLITKETVRRRCSSTLLGLNRIVI